MSGRCSSGSCCASWPTRSARKLLDAHDLVRGTNRTLAGVRTSHGKGAHLEWKLRDDAAGARGVAARLLVDELRDEDGRRAAP